MAVVVLAARVCHNCETRTASCADIQTTTSASTVEKTSLNSRLAAAIQITAATVTPSHSTIWFDGIVPGEESVSAVDVDTPANRVTGSHIARPPRPPGSPATCTTLPCPPFEEQACGERQAGQAEQGDEQVRVARKRDELAAQQTGGPSGLRLESANMHARHDARARPELAAWTSARNSSRTGGHADDEAEP